MADEHKLLREQDRALKAKSLLDNDMLKEAFETLEQEYTKALFLTHIEAPQAREKLFLAVNVLRKVRDHLTGVVNDGTLASQELRGLVEVADRQKTWADIRH